MHMCAPEPQLPHMAARDGPSRNGRVTSTKCAPKSASHDKSDKTMAGCMYRYDDGMIDRWMGGRMDGHG
eukprot:352743-Chlamydomonas_euryale.AAC.22